MKDNKTVQILMIILIAVVIVPILFNLLGFVLTLSIAMLTKIAPYALVGLVVYLVVMRGKRNE